MAIIKKHLAHHRWHMPVSRSVRVARMGACLLTVGGPKGRRGVTAIAVVGLVSVFLVLPSLAPSVAHAELAEVPKVGPVAGGEATFVNDALKVSPSTISGPTNVTVTWEINCTNANYYQYTVSAHDGTGAVVSLDGSGNLVLAHASHDEHSSGTVTVTARVPPGQTYTIALEDPWCGNDTSGSFVHADPDPDGKPSGRRGPYRRRHWRQHGRRQRRRPGQPRVSLPPRKPPRTGKGVWQVLWWVKGRDLPQGHGHACDRQVSQPAECVQEREQQLGGRAEAHAIVALRVRWQERAQGVAAALRRGSEAWSSGPRR